MARALEELPLTGEAMARGRLSFCQARALTRVATPETEAELLPLAASARWHREREIPDDVYFAALEAGFAAVDGDSDSASDGDPASPAPP